jgi:hypothetical protein
VRSLGTIHTPKVLMQSGIGDEDQLRRVGVPSNVSKTRRYRKIEVSPFSFAFAYTALLIIVQCLPIN